MRRAGSSCRVAVALLPLLPPFPPGQLRAEVSRLSGPRGPLSSPRLDAARKTGALSRDLF
eukprot:5127520-Pyramimonas_sp.AAC.1